MYRHPGSVNPIWSGSPSIYTANVLCGFSFQKVTGLGVVVFAKNTKENKSFTKIRPFIVSKRIIYNNTMALLDLDCRFKILLSASLDGMNQLCRRCNKPLFNYHFILQVERVQYIFKCIAEVAVEISHIPCSWAWTMNIEKGQTIKMDIKNVLLHSRSTGRHV